MIIQTKNLIPEVYSHSYDMSLFTGILDMIYTARELDTLRARYSHIPSSCFKEDLPHLASMFGLGVTSNRSLIQQYRTFVKYKGTRDAVLSLAQFACDIEPNRENVSMRLTTQLFERNSSQAYGKVIKETVFSVSERSDVVGNRVYPTDRSGFGSDKTGVHWQSTLYGQLGPSQTDKNKDSWEEISYHVEDGKIKWLGGSGVRPNLSANNIRTHSMLELFLNFREQRQDLFLLLVKRLAPVTTFVAVRRIEEFIATSYFATSS